MKRHPTATLILSMAIGRQKWIEKMTSFLEGAFREYSKQILAERIGYAGHDWNTETDILCEEIRAYLTGKKKTTSNFNKPKAFQEAVNDMGRDRKLRKAKNLLWEHPLTGKQRMMLEKLEIDDMEIFQQFLKKFLLKELKAIGIEMA